jgi:hypothetical protein
MKGTFTCTGAAGAVAAAMLVIAAGLLVPERAAGQTLDYRDATNMSHTQTTTLNGLGQTFTATLSNPKLLDASIMLAKDDSFHTAWTSGFVFELRRGLPGNFDGTSGNILFQSNPLTIDSIPQVGTRFGQEVRELRLSDVGFSAPFTLEQGQLYTLFLRDPGAAGTIGYAAQQPSVYAGGDSIYHARSYTNTFYSGPISVEDLAFQVVMIPEPACAASAGAGLFALFAARRRARVRVGGCRRSRS